MIQRSLSMLQEVQNLFHPVYKRLLSSFDTAEHIQFPSLPNRFCVYYYLLKLQPSLPSQLLALNTVFLCIPYYLPY